MPTPTPVQHFHSAQGGYDDLGSGPSYADAVAGSPFTVYLPNNTLAGNTLILAILGTGSTGVTYTYTIADNLSQSGWTLEQSYFSSSDNAQFDVFVFLGTAANVNTITLTPSTTVSYPVFIFSEFNNITAYDVGVTNHGTGTAATTGSMTTTAAGDLIWVATIQCNLLANQMASLAPGSGFTWLSADIVFGQSCEFQIQTSAGAINSATTLGTSCNWISIAVSFKAGTAGTLPTYTPRIIRRLDSWIDNVTTRTLYAPCSGNMLAVLQDSYSGSSTLIHASAITDSHGNTWTQRQLTNAGNASFGWSVQAWDTDAATTTTSSNTTVTATWTTTARISLFTLLDIQAPLSSGNYDTVASANGDQTSTANLTTVSITPSTANGMVLHKVQEDWGSMLSLVSPASGTFYDIETYPQETGAVTDSLDENGGIVHTYNTSTSAITYTWTYTPQPGDSGVGYWVGIAVAYKGAAAGIVAIATIPYPSIPAALLAI